MDAQNGLGRARIGARAMTIVLAAVVAWLLLPYVTGLIGAAIFYVVASPLTRHVAEGRHRRVTAFVTVFLLFFLLVLPGTWLLVQLLGQIPDAARSVQQSPAVAKLMALRVGTLDVGSLLQRAATDIIGWSSRQTVAALGSLVGATLNLIVALFGAYYLMIAGDQLWERTRGMLPFCPTTAELLRVRFHRVTEAMLLGVVLAGLAQGTLVGIAFAALGFDHALLWSAVTAVVSILPMFGSALVWLPATLVLVARERVTAAIVLAVYGTLLISNIDNVLRLFVYRRVSHIHPMVTLTGAFAGVSAFGFAGLLIGPLLLSYAIELLKIRDAGDAALAGAAAAGPQGQGFPLPAPVISPTPAATGNS